MGMRWDPMRDAMSLREAMDRLLEDSFIGPRGAQRTGRAAQTLPIDLWETEDSLQVRVPLPGVKPEAEDLEITVHGNVLTIRADLPGVGSEEADEARGRGMRWIHREVPRGEATRTVELPMEVDAEKARAHFGDGLLLLTLPKAQAARPRQIKITPAEAAGNQARGAPQPNAEP